MPIKVEELQQAGEHAARMVAESSHPAHKQHGGGDRNDAGF